MQCSNSIVLTLLRTLFAKVKVCVIVIVIVIAFMILLCANPNKTIPQQQIA